jgi:cell fate regulator YaaT (PSP1 superfamily)
MTAVDPNSGAAVLHMVSHGKSGGLGCFVAESPVPLERGTQVVVESARGLEAGQVVGPASQRHARLLGPALAGRLLRPFNDQDVEVWQNRQRSTRVIFDRARDLAEELGLPLEILDVDMLFDGSQAIMQFLGEENETGLDSLARSLEAVFDTAIRFENLQHTTAQEEESHGGCGKPDCGKSEGGSCGTCSTGGGCSSCGSGGVDIKPYFAHLRGKMDAQRERVPLL